MKNLSPAAQAVLAGYAAEKCRQQWSGIRKPPCHPKRKKWKGCAGCVDNFGAAAALRSTISKCAFTFFTPKLAEELLVVADELESHPALNSTSQLQLNNAERR